MEIIVYLALFFIALHIIDALIRWICE